MKLYATIESYEQSRLVKKGSNERLTIILHNGNKNIGLLTLNAYTNELVLATRENNEYKPIFRMKI